MDAQTTSLSKNLNVVVGYCHCYCCCCCCCCYGNWDNVASLVFLCCVLERKRTFPFYSELGTQDNAEKNLKGSSLPGAHIQILCGGVRMFWID